MFLCKRERSKKWLFASHAPCLCSSASTWQNMKHYSYNWFPSLTSWVHPNIGIFFIWRVVYMVTEMRFSFWRRSQCNRCRRQLHSESSHQEILIIPQKWTSSHFHCPMGCTLSSTRSTAKCQDEVSSFTAMQENEMYCWWTELILGRFYCKHIELSTSMHGRG